MFEEQAERFKEKTERFKEHVENHKSAYVLAGGVGLVATGLVVGRALGRTQIVNTVSPTIAPVMNNTSNVNFGGYSTKIVKCLETGQLWESVKDAAEAAGVNAVNMSRHINGHTPEVKGLHYVIVGMGTAGC